MKTYAYVTYSHCKRQEAVLPGTFVGRNQTPVSRHHNYGPWIFGKRDTLAIMTGKLYISGLRNRAIPHYRKRARLVAELRGWA